MIMLADYHLLCRHSFGSSRDLGEEKLRNEPKEHLPIASLGERL